MRLVGVNFPFLFTDWIKAMDRRYHFYNSFINDHENLIIVLFWSKTFQFEILSSTIEKIIPFSRRLMHLLAVLWNSPARVIWISISQESVCDQKAPWVESLQASAGWPRQMAALNPWTVKTRLKAKLERDEIWASLRGLCFSEREKGEKSGALSAIGGRLRQIKDWHLWERFVLLDVYFTAGVCASWDLARSTYLSKRGCRSRTCFSTVQRVIQYLILQGRGPELHSVMAHSQVKTPLGSYNAGLKIRTKINSMNYWYQSQIRILSSQRVTITR